MCSWIDILQWKKKWERFGWFLTQKIDFESQILAPFDSSPLIQNSEFNNFLWVCWFLGKHLSNFVSHVWKLHNPYCHILHSSSSFNTLTKVSGFVLSIFGKFAYLEKRKAWGLRKGFIKYWALFLHENRQ